MSRAFALAFAVLAWVGLAPAAPPRAKCVPPSKCCHVCVEGKACGNACIPKEKTCAQAHGCACDAKDVCAEDP